MAFDMFLKLDGIKGESTDRQHKDEIDLISFSWSETNAGRTFGGGGGTGAGAGAGRAVFHDFNFTHQVDKATPLLFFACASGQHIATATLTCRRPGSQPGITAAAPDAPVPAPKPGEFLIYQMTNVLISSFSDAGVSADEDRPTETITLNFTQLQIEYTPQNADGANGPSITRGWNVRTNQKV
jgi:type VI secretion system secreted protein Hcp